MKYIKKIILENFQSHKYTEIELNNKLNIIVGPSDSGKTAIMRAIKWALYNEPSGDYFIREGESQVSVSLIFSDNTKLIRYRSRTKNVYELVYSNGEDLRLEGFGTGVPEEIKEAVGIYKINLDGKETNSINLGEQLEGPFLLSEKTSTRASAIGQLVGVNVIDEALREVLKDVRTLNITKKNLEEEINLLNDEIETYAYLEQLKKTVNTAVAIKEKLLESKILLDKLNSNHKILNNLTWDINRLQKIKDRLSRLEDIDEILNSIESKNQMYWNLCNYNKNFNKVIKNIKINEILLNNLRNIDESIIIEKKLVDSIKGYNRLLNSNFKYNRIKEEELNLLGDLNDLSEYLGFEDNLIRIQRLYERLLKLSNIKKRYVSVKISINKGNNYIEKLKFIDEAQENKNALENKTEMLKRINKLYDNNLIICKDIAKEIKIINKAKSDIKLLVDKYKSILISIERCPLCFSDIHNDKIEHILEHYIGG